MNVKRRLVESLPTPVTRLLARPYDRLQTWRADRAFRERGRPTLEPSADAPGHVVCLVVDALRGDAVDEGTTPFMASLDGPTDAVAPSTWTFPSVSSMVTGSYPHEHGALRPPDGGEGEEFTLPPRLPDERLTVPDLYAAAGYDTYGGFGHDTPFIALLGRFATHDLGHQVDSSAAAVLADHRRWIERRDRDATFSYVHLADPHIPVSAPDSYREVHGVDDSIPNLENWEYRSETDPDRDAERYRDHRRRLYAASVDYVDDCLREHVSWLEERLDDLAIVVTSDHGEAMWEQVALDTAVFDGHGCVGHGGTPYEAVSRVPLLSDDLPTGAAAEEPVSLVDLGPTLLGAAGLDDHLSPTGVDLHDPVPRDRRLLVEGTFTPDEIKAVYDGRYKLVASETGAARTFELPDETVVDLDADRLDGLRSALPGWSVDLEAGTGVSGVVGDRLDALGYK